VPFIRAGQLSGNAASGNWIDELRKRPAARSWWTTKPTIEVHNTVRLLDKLAARKQAMDGYTSQYKKLEDKQMRPSEFLAAVGELRPAIVLDGTVVVVDSEPEQRILGSS
jgi:hypothetical protein